MSNRFSNSVLQKLIASGWYDGRKVETQGFILPGTEIFQAALNVLSEFGGLHIGNVGPGKDHAAGDVFIDPAESLSCSSEVQNCEQIIGANLYEIGYYLRKHGSILIDQDGKMYLLVDGILVFIAGSFDQALEKLLLGLSFDSD